MSVTARPTPAQLAETLGVELDPDILVLALTHRSFAHEAGGIPTNERLEFLGDSVLGVVATEALYRRFPDLPEGALAPTYAGVRPKLAPAGGPATDFVLDGPAAHGLPGLVNLFGIESPGLTASLALAEAVTEMLG